MHDQNSFYTLMSLCVILEFFFFTAAVSHKCPGICFHGDAMSKIPRCNLEKVQTR